MLTPFFSSRIVIALLIGLMSLPILGFSQTRGDSSAEASAPEDPDVLYSLVAAYHAGFTNSDFDQVRRTLGTQLTMTNGNASDSPNEWQAHQFLSGEEIDAWIANMLQNAAPFRNTIELLSTSERNNCAIVVTIENGKNSFRRWRHEVVTYYLGKIDGEWKIVGFFIKDAKNPED